MGKRIVLTEAQEIQIRDMRREEKTYAEVREFFQNEYAINLNDPLITKISKGGHSAQPSEAAQTIAGMRKKKNTKKREQESDPKSGQDQARVLIRQAYVIHKQGFLQMVEEETKES